MKPKLLLSILVLFGLVTAHAQGLNILTEEDPPYSFTKDGNPTGFGVEITKEILKRINSEDSIKIQPWPRIYKTILTKPNTVVFTMSRTKEREFLFQWVGPIVENDWVIVGKKGSSIKIEKLDDAKKLKGIGTVRDYAWTYYLLEKGFHNLDMISERKQNALKLRAGHIQAFVSADASYKHEILDNGLDPSDFEILFRFNSVQMYIAHSKETDTGIVKKWQSSLDEMKRDGTFLKLQKKWLPDNQLPGAARPAS